MALDVENLVPQSKVGHYVIHSRIAAGGMGIVYKAFEPYLSRFVAIKVLRPEYACNPQHVTYFQEEARAVAALRHPNIVPIHFIGEEQDVVFFSMSFINGETFDEWIERKQLFKPRDAVWFLNQATTALEVALKAGIIHHDIKPANFLIDQSNTIILTDFGLAERLRGAASEAGTHRCYGTPDYSAPEQMFDGPTDQRADIYALGGTLFHLMVGSTPYPGETPQEIMMGHLQKPFPIDRALAANVPRGWISLMQRMMEREPENRISSYPEIRAAVEALSKSEEQLTVNLPGGHRITSVVALIEAVAPGPDQEDVQTLRQIQKHLEQVLLKFEALGARSIKTLPRSILLSFPTGSGALGSCVQFQEECLRLNATRLPADQIQHRIGIHYGELFITGHHVLGECINIAVKLQSLAATGSICISSSIMRMIEKPHPYQFTQIAALASEADPKAVAYLVSHAGLGGAAAGSTTPIFAESTPGDVILTGSAAARPDYLKFATWFVVIAAVAACGLIALFSVSGNLFGVFHLLWDLMTQK